VEPDADQPGSGTVWGVIPLKGFFAYPPERVYSRPCSVMADGAEDMPPRHLAC
jgi:hypothetical protein